MKVSILQMDVIIGKPWVNLAKLKTMTEEIEDGLVVVPELFLTGYDQESIEKTAFSQEEGEYIGAVKEISETKGISIYGSLAETDGENFYNTAVMIDGGKVLGKYRKSHLFGPMGEKKIFTHGRQISTVNLLNTTFGMSICYDLRFPGIYQKLAKLGSKILLISAEWPVTRISHWIALSRARAIENQVFVIAVNRVGKDPNYTYGGNSAIFDPYGEVVIQLGDKEEQRTLDIDLSKIYEFKDKFDVVEDQWI